MVVPCGKLCGEPRREYGARIHWCADNWERFRDRGEPSVTLGHELKEAVGNNMAARLELQGFVINYHRHILTFNISVFSSCQEAWEQLGFGGGDLELEGREGIKCHLRKVNAVACQPRPLPTAIAISDEATVYTNSPDSERRPECPQARRWSPCNTPTLAEYSSAVPFLTSDRLPRAAAFGGKVIPP